MVSQDNTVDESNMGDSDEHAKYLAALLAVIGIVMLALGVHLVRADPYWLWNTEPAWLAQWDGHSRALDYHNRLAKSLQVVTQRPKLVVLGSSRVYRGIDTGMVTGIPTYNLGISSMRIREAAAFASHTMRWTTDATLVLGLDYFMFNAKRPHELGFDPNLEKPTYVLDAFPTALISRTALDDSALALSGTGRGDGVWRRHGFKQTHPRNRAQLDWILKSFPSITVTDAEYDVFAQMLQNWPQMIVFISPMNVGLIEHYRQIGELEKLRTWKARIAEICTRYSVQCHDFSESNPFHSEPVVQRSSRHWIDASHYGPGVGAWILEQLDFETRACLSLIVGPC